MRDWITKIGSNRELVQRIDIDVDLSNDREFHEMQEKLQRLLSASMRLPGLRHFGILVLNRNRSGFTIDSIYELLCHGAAVINRLCPRLSRLISSAWQSI